MEQQYDKWQDFWDHFLLSKYGKEEVQTEDDLYLQVARTWNRKPVDKTLFERIIANITRQLGFSQDDVLVDFCCGNGLFTYELKDEVKQIVGVDFSESILTAAKKYKAASNITYCLGSVTEFMNDFESVMPGVIPDKYLMNDSLAYFTINDLEQILASIKKVSPHFKALFTGVPNEELKWNYYNTEERRAYYEEQRAKGDLTNGGLGNWWDAAGINAVCKKLDLGCNIKNQDEDIANFRMDVLVSR